MMKYRCGLNLSPQPPSMMFSAYFNATALPPTPTVFGHQNLIGPKQWKMLGNDRISDCTIAGAMHASSLWNKIAGHTVMFTEMDAIEDYRDACGYVIGNPATDNGGDMVQVAKYWQTVGMRDALANRHKIAAYLQVDASNLAHVYAAAYLFGVVGLGVTLTQSAEAQFELGEPWTVVPNDTPSDYHYVPMVGRTAECGQVVTWGALQGVSDSWLAANLKEVVAVISEEAMINQKSAEGFAYNDLASDLAAL